MKHLNNNIFFWQVLKSPYSFFLTSEKLNLIDPKPITTENSKKCQNTHVRPDLFICTDSPDSFEISGQMEITSDRNWDIYERVSGRGCPGGLAPGLGLGGLGGGLSAGGGRDGGGNNF